MQRATFIAKQRRIRGLLNQDMLEYVRVVRLEQAAHKIFAFNFRQRRLETRIAALGFQKIKVHRRTLFAQLERPLVKLRVRFLQVARAADGLRVGERNPFILPP
jgi:hypothetical protein